MLKTFIYNCVFYITRTTAPSAAPNNVTAADITAFSLLMRWNPPAAEQQNGIIREYFVNITEKNTGREFQIMTRSPAAELQVQFLHPYYLYSLAVAAITTAVGPFSYSVQAVTASAREFPRTFLVPYGINLSRTLFVLRTFFYHQPQVLNRGMSLWQM